MKISPSSATGQNPAEVAPDDARHLTVVAEAAPEGSDLRIVEAALAPIRGHYAVIEARGGLAELMTEQPARRSPAFESAARTALTAKIAEENPASRPVECSNRAKERLAELWAAAFAFDRTGQGPL